MQAIARKLVLCAALCVAGANAPGARAEEIRVLAAGAVQHSVITLAQSFERETGHKITASFGTAGAVNAKVEAGEPVDLALSGVSGLQALAAKGLLDDGGVKTLGTVRIAVGVKTGAPRPDISSLAAFKAALLAAPSFAYADPASGATTGIHFAKKLAELGIADAVSGKAVLRNGGLVVMQAVAEGKAAFGVTQASEIIASPGVEMIGYIPDEVQLATAYGAAVTRKAEHGEAARAFLAYLTGAKAAEVLKREGFETAR